MNKIIPEHLKTEHEINFFVQGRIEEFKAAMAFARGALSVAILINGGAAIAILALLGHIWEDKSLSAYLAGCLLPFSIGVLAGAVGTGLSYLTQCSYLAAENEGQQKKADWGRMATIGCIIFSYITFAGGALWACFVFAAQIYI